MTIRTAGLLFCLALLARAQLYTGSVTGIVVDPSGAPVFQADVSLTDVDRNTHSAAKTDGGGRYLLPALPPGNYALEVNAPGFQPYDVTKIAIDVNGTVTANANLLLSGQQIDIRVESEASLLSEDATISQTLTRQLINDLPLVNRNTFDLAFLAPGVSQAPGSTYGNGVAPQLAQPIFTAGRLKNNVKLAEAEQEHALVQYEKTIQTAFAEVSNSLIAHQRTHESRQKQEDLVYALENRVRLAYVRYRGGVDTQLNALDADRDLFSAQLSLSQIRLNELLTIVQLYKPLGGGWQ